MRILALDLGTNTGWAWLENDRVESGVQVFDVKRGESSGMRYLRFNRWLEQFAALDHEPDVIVWEMVHNRGGAATEVANGFSTRVHEFIARRRIDGITINHASVHSATLKKFATGSGRADKGDMIAAAQRLKPGVTDDNEADALLIMEWSRKEFAA